MLLKLQENVGLKNAKQSRYDAMYVNADKLTEGEKYLLYAYVL